MHQLYSREDIPTKTVEALQTALGQQLIAVILYGSRARGEARAESDWDLLVVAEGLPERVFERHLSLKRLLPPDFRGAVSILAKTPGELKERVPSLYLDIALDGQILYDPHKYASRWLGAIQKTISRAGLRRERTAAGDIWHWQEEPEGSLPVDWESN